MASRDNWIYQHGVLWSAELEDLGGRPIATQVPAKFGQIQRQALDELITTVSVMDPIAPTALAQRFTLDKQCFAMQVGKLIVAYGWLTLGPEWVGEFERELQLQAGEAYIWDCATLPDFRRQRLFSALLSHLTHYLQQAGLRRLWIIGNHPATAINQSVAAAGFQPILRLRYVRLFDKRCLLATPQPGASAPQIATARRLLKNRDEQVFGPLIIGNSARPVPPATHFDR